ncbi:ExbD/TolR family protein [Verrucomicrobiota bacterium]
MMRSAVARRKPLTSLKQISEINLTPLMDLTFILLITFIITFPLIEQAIPVKLPKGKAAEVKSVQSRTVSIDRNGVIYIDNLPVDLDQLGLRIKALVEIDPETTILVRADERIIYGNLVKVMKVLYGAQVSKMALVTEADGK